MLLEPWFPTGHRLPSGQRTKRVVASGTDWQIVETDIGYRTLIAQDALAGRWTDAGLLEDSALEPFTFGADAFRCLASDPTFALAPVASGVGPQTLGEAMAFAVAMKATRQVDKEAPLQDAIYVERRSRLLPTYSISSRTEDDVVLGFWLSAGAHVSARSFRRLHQLTNWLPASTLKRVVETAGFDVPGVVLDDGSAPVAERTATSAGAPASSALFELPGRPDLEAFLNEHVVDIVRNSERYRALGIDFPGAVVLHGPPGTGKTFAIERLIDYLGWPTFQIDAASVASPYIHDTSRKVAEVFGKAMDAAPSVLVIDEMEAFLADRNSSIGDSHHRVEEVAEFLRRIPEATKKHVLIIAMTNRIDLIDDAILRRGRFDHVLEVGYAEEQEIRALLDKLLKELPTQDVDSAPLAKSLAGRPLSDVTFVVREGARLAARAGKDKLDQVCLTEALAATPPRGELEGADRRIGFV